MAVATKMTFCSLNRKNEEMKESPGGRSGVKDTFSNIAKVTDGCFAKVTFVKGDSCLLAGIFLGNPILPSGDALVGQSVKVPCLLRHGASKRPRLVQ